MEEYDNVKWPLHLEADQEFDSAAIPTSIAQPHQPLIPALPSYRDNYARHNACTNSL